MMEFFNLYYLLEDLTKQISSYHISKKPGMNRDIITFIIDKKIEEKYDSLYNYIERELYIKIGDVKEI
ncbi:MAG: hypothetical protein ACFFDN_45905 [Candidatus Hodarchaeota archaeon]